MLKVNIRNNPKAWIVFLFILALAIRVLVSYDGSFMLVITDEVHYSLLAKSIADFSNPELILQYSSIPPLYPLAISPAYIFFDDMHNTLQFAKIINIILMLLGLIPAMMIAYELFGSKKRYIFTFAMLLILIPYFFWNITLMSENLFFAFYQWIIYFIYKYLNNSKNRYLILYGFFIGCALLTKVAGFLSLPYMILIPIIKEWTKESSVTQKFKNSLKPLLICLCIPLIMNLIWVLIKNWLTKSSHSFIGNFYYNFFFGGAYGEYPLSAFLPWLFKFVGFHIMEFSVLPVILSVALCVLVLRKKTSNQKVRNLCLIFSILFTGLLIGVWISMGVLQTRLTSRYSFHIIPLLLVLSFYLLSQEIILKKEKVTIIVTAIISVILMSFDLILEIGNCANFDSIYRWLIFMTSHFTLGALLLKVYLYAIVVLFVLSLFIIRLNKVVVFSVFIIPLLLAQNFSAYYQYQRADNDHNFFAYSNELISLHDSLPEKSCLYYQGNEIYAYYYLFWNNQYDTPVLNFFIPIQNSFIKLGDAGKIWQKNHIFIYLKDDEQPMKVEYCDGKKMFIYTNKDYNASVFREGPKKLYMIDDNFFNSSITAS